MSPESISIGNSDSRSDGPVSRKCEWSKRDETSLVANARSGDADAFFELVRPYMRAVFVTALGIVRDESTAEDVAQETFLRAFKGISSFRGEAKFSTWLIQIAINEARLKAWKERRHLHESFEEGISAEDGDYIPREFADWREIPSEALARKELRDLLRRSVDSLPEIYRMVVLLRDVQNLSITDTAKALCISEANVKTRLSRARLQLRDMLAKYLSIA